MIGDFRTDLEPQVERTEALIIRAVHDAVPSARLRRIGPIDFDPPSWSCWIVTATDGERDALEGDAMLRERLWKVAREEGFPPDGFAFQSDETVTRDYEGNWFEAMR